MERFFFTWAKAKWIRNLWKVRTKTNKTEQWTLLKSLNQLMELHQNNLLASQLNITDHWVMIAMMCISKFRYGETCRDLNFEKEPLLWKHLLKHTHTIYEHRYVFYLCLSVGPVYYKYECCTAWLAPFFFILEVCRLQKQISLLYIHK